MRQITIPIFVAVLFLLFAGCQSKNKLPRGEGFLTVKGGKIWYRVVGQGDKIPILLLHGGPGYPSYYLNPLLALGNERPVIIFDQLGCGRSDRISDTTLMAINNYVDQTHDLITHLDVEEFYLYGHSWGTMLGLDYYLKYPDGVKALILDGALMNTALFEKDQEILIEMLPDSIQTPLKLRLDNIVPDSSKLNEAMGVFYRNFYLRNKIKVVDLDSSSSQMGYNEGNYMWGPSLLLANGTLKSYDRISQLEKIKVSTLYIAAEFDVCRPVTLKYFQSLTPGSKFIMIENSGHFTMHDNIEQEINTISTFINDIEKK